MNNYQILTAASYARLLSKGAEPSPKVVVKALADVREWSKYVTARQRRGKSPESTAKHISRFGKDKTVCACKKKKGKAARDCACLMYSGRGLSDSAGAGRSAGKKAERSPERALAKRGRGGKKINPSSGKPYSPYCDLAMRPQAFMFPRERYTKRTAEAWIKAHQHSVYKTEETLNYWRVSVEASPRFRFFRLKPLPGFERHAIRVVWGCPKLKLLKPKKVPVSLERVPRKLRPEPKRIGSRKAA